MELPKQIPVGHGEAVFLQRGNERVGCEVHDWTEEDFRQRLVTTMRERHGKGGLNVCVACLERARAFVKENVQTR